MKSISGKSNSLCMKGLCMTLLLCILAGVQGCSHPDGDEEVRQEIESIMTMKELGLVEYRVRKIIKADDQGEWYKIGDRKILLSCTAYLKAGIDLSKVSAEDIVADRSTGKVTVTLSPAVDFADLDGNLLISNDRFLGVQVVDGRLTLPDIPGIGVKVL